MKDKITFADKVKKALKKYPTLTEICQTYKAWKYICKNNPSNYRMRYRADGQLLLEQRKWSLNWFRHYWISIGNMNRVPGNTIGDWIK